MPDFIEVGVMSESKIRVLLVDDEQELIEYMVKRLSHKGFEVKGATSGAEALEAAENQTFDVAVLDLKMPEMNGIEVLQRLKEIQPMMQVIMLTGHGSMDSALESGRHDAFRFLVKPYEVQGLVDAIEEGFAKKRRDQKAAFDEAINELISSSSSPHEIMAETRRLRQEYEQ
jgi:DNA-binding NtrC family response regulator